MADETKVETPGTTTNEAPATTATEVVPPREGSPLGAAPSKEDEKTEDKADAKSEDKTEEKTEGDKPEALTAEQYKEFVSLPEGVTVDDGLMGKFTEFAANAKLTKEQTEAAVGLYFETQDQLLTQLAGVNQKAWDTTLDTWKEAIQKDPVIGGDKMESVQITLGEALDEYGSKEARQAFEVTGAGWNPHIIKFIYAMAQALGEGKLVTGQPPADKGPRTLGQAIYGTEQAA